MASVVVTIAGRTYRVGCEDGQEPHLERLAREVDARMGELRGSFGEIGEQRLAVMTALMVADEVDAARKRIEALQGEKEAGARRVAELEAAVERTVERVERIAGLFGSRS